MKEFCTNSRLLSTVAFICLVAVVLLLFRPNDEPTYKDRPLRQWLEEFGYRGLTLPQDQAVLHCGTNAIPYLLKWADERQFKYWTNTNPLFRTFRKVGFISSYMVRKINLSDNSFRALNLLHSRPDCADAWARAFYAKVEAEAHVNKSVATKSNRVLLRRGALRLQKTSVQEVLKLYAELSGKTLLPMKNLPELPIIYQNQTPLTREEALKTLKGILELHGICLVPQGDLFVIACNQPKIK